MEGEGEDDDDEEEEAEKAWVVSFALPILDGSPFPGSADVLESIVSVAFAALSHPLSF